MTQGRVFLISLPSVGRVEPGTRARGQSGVALPPLPVLAIEAGGRRLVKEPVVRVGVDPLCGGRPALARVPHRFDDQPTWLGVELHLVRELRFLEQRLGNADAARVADPHDARLRRHW